MQDSLPGPAGAAPVSARPRHGWSPALEVSGLTKKFGDRTVVDNVCLAIPRGCAFGYVGPNGAGKTTLIRMVLGLTPATSGSMRVLGFSVPAQRALALEKVGAIVDEPRFHGHLTGRQNLRLLAAAREPGADRRIESSLEQVGLRDRAVEEALHLHNPRQYNPAGGTHGLVSTDLILAELGPVAAILFGASAGASDVSAGVFRNLVTTGRSRVALFLARIPAGLALSVAFTMAGYAVAVASSVLLAGSQHVPAAQLILAGGGWLILNTSLACLLSLGLSSVTGSQAITVGVMLALNMFVMPVLAAINAVPSLRQLLPDVALYRLQPKAIGEFSSPNLVMSTAMIAVVLIGWAALAVGAGIWRTASRDA